jgi:hypothetical protein
VVEELTSRKGSIDIPRVLDQLEVRFEPEPPEGGRRGARPIDVLLATNMVSVGVDVKRLGLMAVAGQPKNTAEYIQATSRVGRSFPGLVCTVYNWARPRDISHYERFEHYHATFYQQVEALSVTPFAPRAMDRGLTALLVSLVRLAGTEFNANDRAAAFDPAHAYVPAAIDAIARRVDAVESRAAAERVRIELRERVGLWTARTAQAVGPERLGYRTRRDQTTLGLLEPAGDARWGLFTCLNSLRDVERTAALILDDRGLDQEPQPAPAAPAPGGTS